MSQRKGSEPLTYGDRLVTALIGGVCGFLTMAVVWFLVMYAASRSGNDLALPFYWTWVVAGGVAASASLAGPERTMDAFEWVWGLLASLLFWRADRSDGPKRRRIR